MSVLYLLLPSLARFDALADMERLLARGDALPPGAVGELASSNCFHWGGGALPVAALLRDHLRHDAGNATWLCMDLAHVRADMTGARMLACGNLDVSLADATALADALRPALADLGMKLEPTQASRWHLRMPDDATLPTFDPPSAVLGDDIARHLPQGSGGRAWRKLFNEIQIILHQHPLNRGRVEIGQLPVNSVWFWGAGHLAGPVSSTLGNIFSDSELTVALATCAQVNVRGVQSFDATRRIDADTLVDLRHATPETCLGLARDALQAHCATALVLHFADGERWRLTRAQRWRLWRRPAS